MKKKDYKLWLILSISVLVIAVLFLVLYSPARTAIFGKAMERGNVLVSELTCKIGTNGEIIVGKGSSEKSKTFNCLKDYDITVGKLQGTDNQGSFVINGDSFTLDVKDIQHTNSGTVILNSVLYQAFILGKSGASWDLTGACPSNYIFDTYRINSDTTKYPGLEQAEFEIYYSSPTLPGATEKFTLETGQSKVLGDGAKIILRNNVYQAYAGGTVGVHFELIC